MFDGSGSSGVISSYSWNFGDGATGVGVMPTHAYGAAGTYTVTLTVIGTGGQQATDTAQVTISQPSAGGWTTPTGDSGNDWDSRKKARDGSTSTYASNGRYDENDIGAWTPYLTATHDPIYVNRVRVYVQSRYFTHVDIDIYNLDKHSWRNVYDGTRSGTKEWVTTNEFGTIHTDKMRVRFQLMSHRGFGYLEVPVYEMQFYQVGASPTPSNQSPVAAFTSSPAAPLVGSMVLFNGSSSSDADGSIISYAWNFGDGSTGSGVTVQHAYAIAGTYTARLTVTDNDGATGTTTRQVTVGQATPSLSIQLSLPKMSYQVGEPIVINYSTNREAYVYIYDADPSGKVTLLFPSYLEPNNRVPAGAHSVPSGGYTLRVSAPEGSETLYAFAATSPISSFPTNFGSGFPILSYNPSSFLSSVRQTMQNQLPAGEGAGDILSFTVVSSAPQTGTLWVTSSPQGAFVTIDGAPAGTTPIQVSVTAGTHTVTLSLAGYQTVTQQATVFAGQTAYVQVPMTPQMHNQPPVAVISLSSATPSIGETIFFNGSGSTDPDGWIVSYLWDFGDGTGASGVQATHAYATSGTYLVHLMVSDNQGLAHTTSRTVVVSSSAPPPPWGGGTGAEPPMGGTPGIFVWGTNTWHITVNAGAYWTGAHSYRLELRTDKSFSGVNQSTSGGVVPLGVIPTPTDGGKTLVFEGSLQNGSVDYTFTAPESASIWMSLKLDIDGNGTLDESPSFVYLRTFMVHPPQVPFVVGLQKGDSGPLVPSINFRVGTALTYTTSVRFIMWSTDIATLEGY
jgi:PKD repeat protein